MTFHFKFCPNTADFESNEHVTYSFKIVPVLECPMRIRSNRTKKEKDRGKHFPVYRRLYWEDRYMYYTFHEIMFSVDKIQLVIKLSWNHHVKLTSWIAIGLILNTFVNWWYWQVTTCIWSPIFFSRRRRRSLLTQVKSHSQEHGSMLLRIYSALSGVLRTPRTPK